MTLVSGIVGQGRKFQIDDALESATSVFWIHGYEGSSISALTGAMGINPPSLYKAFGSKELLFFRVVDHYNATHGGFMAVAFAEEKSGIMLARRLLLEAAIHYAEPAYPGGCLTISSAVTVTAANRHVADRLMNMRNENIQEIAAALDRDVRVGILPPDTDTQTLAAYVGATMQGMSQQARDGANQDKLTRIAELAVSALPEPSRTAPTEPQGVIAAGGEETPGAHAPESDARFAQAVPCHLS